MPGGALVLGDLTTSIEANQWQHVVLVRDGATRQIRGYKNGALALSSSYRGSHRTRAPTTSTSAATPPATLCFRGSIDEVRIYDRVLSASEIQALYRRLARHR